MLNRARAALRTFRRRWKSLLLLGGALAAAIALAWLFIPQTTLYPESLTFSKVLEDRHGQVIHLALTPDGKYRMHVPLEDIRADLIEATLLQEDRHFYTHPGFNPMSLMRAVWGVVTGTRRGGGSTVTMQYARLRFGLHTRNAWGKVEQILRAIQLERHYSKKEILEAYLNLAPYGANVEGAAAASWLWCGKPVDKLTLRESVALAVLPQSPTRRCPKKTGDNPSLAGAQYRLMQLVQEARGLRADPLDAQFVIRPEARRPPREHTAPCPSLRSKEPPRLTKPNSSHLVVVRSTVDIAKQHLIEHALENYVARKKEIGIRNACALLVHAPTREVLAYVGSAGFFNEKIQGQVDGVTARRSPGSTLKPFVYALAIQEGLIQPRTLLRDGRMAFGELQSGEP